MLSRKVTKTEVINSVDEQFLTADLHEMEELEEISKKETKRGLKIVWRNVALFTAIHIGATIGAYLFLFKCQWRTFLWTIFLHFLGAFGVTAGAHRLWAHKSYKAALPARILLMLANTLAFQNDVIEWARDHRCHHKWTDTDADPHNSRRGFFFSHVGWLLVRKHDRVKEMGAKIDLSDLYADPVLVFQKRYFKSLGLIISFLLPATVPVYFWGESVFNAIYVASIFRYAFLLNSTWLINSAAHTFGYKPYDKNISPVESVWTNFQAVGEGGHNFHHTFPQDYRASEFPLISNWTRAFIDFLALIGQVYERKTISDETIVRQKANHGCHD